MNNQEVEILLVEDSQDDAELVIRALRKINLANKLIHLEDGQQALDFLFAEGMFSGRKLMERPKLIVLDLKMPRVDGIETLKRIKSDERTRLIPVVMMTSSAEEKDMLISYQLGINSYVVKPVGFENFVKAVTGLGIYWLLVNTLPELNDGES
ncbi:response regulator [Foetidibacter luteolus]|uniref:response regulator n=1 Tax=Foetidibacter luteolus TaxID=2608880 RepID=UPI00129BAB53|nr:response regulator [Foetidibacter luteolus]